MFIQGQRVTCIDDNFPIWARAMYLDLPVKGKIYTIRAVGIGLDVKGYVKNEPKSGKETVFVGEEDIMVLLHELKNPDHPNSKQEMGFLGTRFAPMQELNEYQIESMVRRQEKEDREEIWTDAPVPAEVEFAPLKETEFRPYREKTYV